MIVIEGNEMYVIKLINRISEKGQYLRKNIRIYYPDSWLGTHEEARVFHTHSDALKAITQLRWIGGIGDHYIITHVNEIDCDTKAA